MNTTARKLLRRVILSSCLGLSFLTGTGLAAGIDFEEAIPGTTIIDQYVDHGISFSSGIITELTGGNRVLQVSDTVNPYMKLTFSEPIYHFSAKLFEIQTYVEPAPVPEPSPPPSGDSPPGSSDNPADAPPTDERKPSVYPTLHLTDGTSSDLVVIHALGEWQDLTFQSAKPVSSISLLGHYFDGEPPIYFVIDNITYDHTTPTPEPAAGYLLLSGLLCLARFRKRA